MNKTAVFLVCILLCVIPSHAQSKPALTLQKTITLTGVNGKFDHLVVDTTGNRLFIAATGNHSVEVIDLKSGKIQQSISGLGKPHGLTWVAATGSLYVADGALKELRVYKGTPLALSGTIKLSEDADDMVYDEVDHLLFVGHGGTDAANPAKIAVINTQNFSLIKNLSVAAHPEGLEINAKGTRVFVNIADSKEVAVIDTNTKAITTLWKLTKAADNVPLAFDDQHQLLYVACRTPGTVIALDAASGKEVSWLPSAGKTDDMFYDPAQNRVYVISGDGEIDSYQVDEAKTLHALDVLHTASGAKTAIFVSSQNLLYLAVPGVDTQLNEIRVYATSSIREKE